MLANVLSSARAITMSVRVVREFVRLRTAARSQDSLKKKLRQLEGAVRSRLDRHESKIEELFDAVENLIGASEDVGPAKQIGFAPYTPQRAVQLI
jgi:hypothetical protein